LPPSQLARMLCLFALLTTPSGADEATSPHFLVNGYPLGDARTHLDASETRAYRRALAAFSSAAACLKDGNDPATATLNLEAFSNLEELEVCLFLTADVLRDLEGMRALLERSGFDTPNLIHHPKSNIEFYSVSGDGQAVSGFMLTEKSPTGLVGWFDRIFQARGISTQVLFGPNTEPVTSNASIIRL
jgi:hypothetical protein